MTNQPTILAPSRSDLCAGRFGQMLDRLLEYATQLGARLADKAKLAFASDTPSAATRPTLAFARAYRAVQWLACMANVFTGLYQMPRPRARPVIPAPAAPAPPFTVTATAPRQVRPLGEDRWMRTVFATRPIGEIVARLCRDLGIAETSALWPPDFIAITETLPQWCARTLPPEPAAIRPAPRRATGNFRPPPARNTPQAARQAPAQPIPIRPVRTG